MSANKQALYKRLPRKLILRMNPKELDSTTFSALLGAVSDVILIIGGDGIVEEVSTGQDMMATLGCQAWLGKAWIDTVTIESKKKIQELLAADKDPTDLTWRHVNHPTPAGNEAAIQ